MNHNRVYENLVEHNSDLIGLVAYGLYKEYKREQVIKIKESKKRSPNKIELKQIEDFAINNILQYRNKANELVDLSFEEVIEHYKSSIYEKFYQEYGIGNFKTELELIKKQTKRKFWNELLIVILGNIAWIIILIIISTIVYFNNGGIQKLKEKVIETVSERQIDSINNTKLLK